MNTRRFLVLLSGVAILLSGCATGNGRPDLPPGASARCAGVAAVGGLVGGVLGAGVGAAVGAVKGNPAHGAAIGGSVGVGIGGLSMYSQCMEEERTAYAKAQYAAATAAVAAQQAAAAAATAAPQESCQWAYDHTGAYQWQCQGKVGPRPHQGPPPVVLPPASQLKPMPGMLPAPTATAPSVPPRPM